MSKTRNFDNQFAFDLDETTPVIASSPDNRLALQHTDALLEQLDAWQQAGWIRPLDVRFAQLIRDLSDEQGNTPAPLVLLLAALVSHQVGRGHVCVDLATLMADATTTLSLPPEEPTAASSQNKANPSSSATAPIANSTNTNLGQTRPSDLLAQVSVQECLSALNDALAVSDGSHTTPLVLNGTRLYLRRFWRYEQYIAAGIQQRLAQPSPLADPLSPAAATLSQALDVLFKPQGSLNPQSSQDSQSTLNSQNPQSSVDYQKLACALAARNRFAVITGGPGTGKTTTVVKLLAALQSVAGESPEREGGDGKKGRKYRIRLAAPTGKAAARLNESIGGAVSRLPLAQLPGQVALADIPTKVTTLHRLLGSRPDTRKFRHNQDNPLLVDILVIDEASMVDLDMMASVFDALPASAQLILLGDKDQLASVDAGAVLGELCQRAPDGHYLPATVQWLKAITGTDIPAVLQDSNGQPLDQAVAMLRKSYRFAEGSGIRHLAEAVNTNALSADTLQQARDATFEDVVWLNGRSKKPSLENAQALICGHAISGSRQAFSNNGEGRIDGNGQPLPPPVGYRHYLTLMQNHNLDSNSTTGQWDQLAKSVLQAFSDFQILCALRRGPWGVEGLNDLIAHHLLAQRLIPRAEGWYAGRPVLVTGNDYNLGLMNGDVGITFSVASNMGTGTDPQSDDEKTQTMLRVAFPTSDGSGDIRWISPSRLQQLETVYAMTVHKSQGSEFNHTCLILPDRVSPVLTRELIYTGITRARNWFSLITGDASVFSESVGQQVVRASGLGAVLDE
ncbi:exodeoxyribonuclease V subunit alpha [Marinobacter sp. LV10MA510-1]|uniref:exodeoxyribonuclease V subunit alpha n=1 Tax=Marinobacter sp. LV10MA510-1 TaxID=1415567 RepID=UPI000BF8BB92|nr:exodeoxyribonuclease V subunit alpha [Marinobacter sp. LV10MA510-1]PFG10582.1 DNA helicase/exodeoxyribonuclease V alpha subunit [Marinobacter sp. LV10MA510-1]